MKSTLIASIPALVLIFALTFGFGTFHVMLQKAEASGSNCDDLQYRCNQARENERIACASGNTERCESAKADRMQVCNEYYDTCR